MDLNKKFRQQKKILFGFHYDLEERKNPMMLTQFNSIQLISIKLEIRKINNDFILTQNHCFDGIWIKPKTTNAVLLNHFSPWQVK